MRYVYFALLLFALTASADSGQLEFRVVEKASGKPFPCRIHLKDSAGKPQKPAKLPSWNDHFVCPGEATLELPLGKYAYQIDRGPEYRLIVGEVDLAEKEQRATVAATLERIADLAAEGWWSGEMHVHRPPEEVELLMQAEDLHVAPVITWWNNRNLWEKQPLPSKSLVRFDNNRFYHLMAGEDEREGGALLFFHLDRPLPISGATREHPSPLKFVAEARRAEGAWIDIEKPFWWDVPAWVASGQVDSIGIANNHMCRDRMYENEAWGKPRNEQRLPAPRGNGYWTQEIYYHLLDCGLRLPPSAGSASGVLPNPVGYNRIYAHVGSELSWQGWWDAVRAGRSFVTNGPLLRVTANEKLPGHVFQAAAGASIKVELNAVLTTRDNVPFVEIIKDGLVERKVLGKELVSGASLGSLTFERSGWFLVRAIADNEKTFRFASTAPFYVEIGKQPRISKSSAQFFLDWSRERAGRIKLDDAQQRREVLSHHEAAEKYWREMVAKATVE